MPSLHERAKDLFLAALARPAQERDPFLAAQCGDDTALRLEVESLLQFHDDTTGAVQSGDRPVAAATIPSDEFKPGDVFAGRYRMITRLGRGGMSDVWRADDLVLDTPVALKLIHASGAAGRQQIVNEVRLARQITHPAVCRVFDVGETDGQVFLSMELVAGEDLATLLKRVGRLPSEKVVDIARQLCAGLAAAHGRGVLHRDLKPANVMIDDEGHVRITDFGIAIPRGSGETGSPMGTLAYMAPEQLTQGAPLTECTDLFALGVILYELAVGQRPYDRPGRPTAVRKPSTRVPDIDPQLERVILAALEPDPADRPTSAAAMLEALPSRPGADSRPLWRRWSMAAILALVVVAGGAAWTFLSPGRSTGLTQQDVIVLADFANTTGESVFDGTLKVALAVALEQSPFLKVFPDVRMRDTLRLMGRPTVAPVDRTVAREIARRERLKALLAGSIAPLGSHFVLTLEAVNAETGDVMAREQAEAMTREDVLTVLGAAASRLREKLGESLASIRQFDVPLARATTSSLEALHAYSMALDNGTINPRLEAIPHLKRALELDPQFALAMALLAGTYANTGQTSLAPEYARKAFDLRERVSERERFFISFRYYRDATQDWAQALDLARTWTATYPREAFAFNSLATALIRFGQYEQALAPLRDAIRLDPSFEAPYANLASALLSLGRYDEARAILKDASARQATSFPVRRMTYLLALLSDDAATMNRMLELSIGPGQTNAAHGWQAHTVASRGEVRTAHEQFRRGIQMASQNGFTEVAGQLAAEDAEVHAIVGQCRTALDEVAGALVMSRDNYTLERASRTLALCGQDADASILLRELSSRYPNATLTHRVIVPLTEAVVALQRGDPTRAIEQLEPLKLYDRTAKAEFWTEYVRGLSYLELKDGRAALEQFRSILAHRGEYPNSPLSGLVHLGLARAMAAAGDTQGARQAYLDFLRLWNDADPELEPLKRAREEYARLT
ncbi:MAG: protein kinase [Vicinamibacterales bacterium]